jgi:multidrug efflux pump subunit AcrA (membrane-fusion protein)
MLLAVLPACAAPDKLPTEAPPNVATKPAVADAPVERPDFVGVVTSKGSKTISAPFSARVLKIEARHGLRVKKGDVIARMDDSELQQKLQQEIANEAAGNAEAGQGGAQAGAACAKVRLVQMANKRGARSGQDVAQAIAECNAARSGSGVGGAKAKSARAAQAIIRRQIEQAVITAPVDGVVLGMKMKEGGAVNLGEALARVADPSDLRVKFTVEKEWRKAIEVGNRVELKIDGVDRTIWAAVDRINIEEAPITFAVVEADLDDTKLGPDEVQLASEVHVRIAERTSTKAVATGAVR